MINLFQHMPTGPGSLTAALLALLEYADTSLVNDLLRKAGVPHQIPPGSRLQVAFPAPDGPPQAGVVKAGDFALKLVAQGPGEELPAAVPGAAAPLVVSLSGRAPGAGYALSWEQVDSLLTHATETYDPESRTAFLIQQFRDFLPSRGIQPFPGFPVEDMTAGPAALATVLRVYEHIDQFYALLVTALATSRDGLKEMRQSGPADLMAGYPYRDYTDPALGPALFLRVAFHLPREELQVSVWFTSGVPPTIPDSRVRLRHALSVDEGLLTALRQLAAAPLLWLWSPKEERQIPLDDLEPQSLGDADWMGFQAAIQRSLGLDELMGEGAVARTLALTTELIDVLEPALASAVH